MEWQKLVVKSTKLLLMVNVSPNGALDNDKFMRASYPKKYSDPSRRMSPAHFLADNYKTTSYIWRKKSCYSRIQELMKNWEMLGS